MKTRFMLHQLRCNGYEKLFSIKKTKIISKFIKSHKNNVRMYHIVPKNLASILF